MKVQKNLTHWFLSHQKVKRRKVRDEVPQEGSDPQGGQAIAHFERAVGLRDGGPATWSQRVPLHHPDALGLPDCKSTSNLMSPIETLLVYRARVLSGGRALLSAPEMEEGAG